MTVVRDVLLVVNAVFALVSAGYGVVAVTRPAALLPAAQKGADLAAPRFYAGFYAARALPLAIAVIVAIFVMGARPALPLLLIVSGAAQLGDVVLGIRHRVPGMVIGGAVLAVVHIGTAWWLLA